MTNLVELPKIKEETWKLVQHYLANFERGYESKIFNEKIGQKYVENLTQTSEIGKFQWRAVAGEEFNILPVYLMHFLGNMYIYCQNQSIKITKMQKAELKANQGLKDHFHSQYVLLESEVLIPDYFSYQILIPAFNIILKDVKSLSLDINHIFINIADNEVPYDIKDFRNPPFFWSKRKEEQKWAKDATTSIEVSYNKTKRFYDEEPYTAMPYYPLDPNGKEEFDEIVLSIPDFFMLYSDRHEFFPFSISHYYWVKLPAFSDYFPFVKGYIHYSFPRPNAYLRMYDTDTWIFWKSNWQSHYEWYYHAFYGDDRESESKRIFRYAVNTIRTLNNIQYADLKVFILVSTFEGLLYKKSIGVDLVGNTRNKREPVIKVFKKMSEIESKKWIHFDINNKYEENLEKFLNDAFTVRNNIAHPEEIKEPDFQPEFLYDGIPQIYYHGRLMEEIQINFKEFLWYLLKIWVNKKFQSNEDWYSYLEDVKIQILEG
ncbi:MAG: hypothetical protein ACFFCE_04360 [Promethearchaeota archaeon]